MVIKDGLVFEPEGGFVKKDIYIDGMHKICRMPFKCNGGVCEEVIDAKGLYIIPGLVDIHVHGAVGEDFSDADLTGLGKMAEYLKANGITSFCPTSMTLSEEQLGAAFRTMRQFSKKENAANPIGINMEGPFVSDIKKGAQNGEYLQNPDIEMFKRLQQVSNNKIKLVTIAPELSGALEFIREIKDRVKVSIGHSAAGYDRAFEAFEAGADHVTHLYNAMNPFLHREPGIVGAAAERQNVFAELICDGIHVHPSAVRGAFKLFGADRVVLISDGMRAMGMTDGNYELGGQMVQKDGEYATLTDGTLAGSVTNLANCMRNAVKFGVSIHDAVRAATYNPAKSIGMEREIGQLIPGAEADIILMDENMSFVKII